MYASLSSHHTVTPHIQHCYVCIAPYNTAYTWLTTLLYTLLHTTLGHASLIVRNN